MRLRLLPLAAAFVAAFAFAASADAAPAKRTAKGKSAKVVKAKPKAKVKTGKSRKAAAVDDGPLAVKSSSALVIDPSDGKVIYEKNAQAVMPIASITKLMTAMVVLESRQSLTQTVAIADDDVDTLKNSRSRLAVGAELSREELLLLALMSSENRAAHALARNHPGGIEAFVAAMNQKAAELGLQETRFVDPTGLSADNVSSARDLSRMVAAASRFPLIRELSTTPEKEVDVLGRAQQFRNTNVLVKNPSWDITVSKTGFIHEAGKCLVMQARLADRPVVIVLLDSVGSLTRIGDANRIKRYVEHRLVAEKKPTVKA